MQKLDKSSPFHRWLITAAVMSATLMQVLDTTIVNVSLPHMQGNLGATPDQISWVLTCYLISSAIMMPLTGYFTDIFGRRNFLLYSIAGFVVASAFCGAAQSLDQIIFFRLLQGVFGAPLVPLSQAIMADSFSDEERGKAMAIWGVGVMVGPILGPTLGGYLTSVASWRWNFYVNLPVGLLSLFIAWRVIADTPKKQRLMDWMGLILISTAIGSMQYVLDRGSQYDWFESQTICFATFLMVVSFVGFIFHSLSSKKSVFDIRIFKDRNFTLSSMTLAFFGLGLNGAMVVLPMLLEGLLNYPVMTTGLVMAPRGIAGMVSMMVVGKISNKVDPRVLVATGIIVSVIGMWIGTYYSLDISVGWLIFPLIIQGLGLGMIFVPLSIVAFSTLPVSMRAEAAGLYSLLRTIGGSVGISITMTVYTRHAQMAWNQIGSNIHVYNPALNTYLQNTHSDIHDPTTIALLAQQLSAQSTMVAFTNVFAFISFSFLAMLPLILLLKKNEKTQAPVEVMAE